MTATGATWRNWARTESARPYRVERPADAWAVQRAVRAAADSGLRIKPVGAGHSFTGIAVAPDVQLDLADLSGVIDADAATGRVTLGAGTHLHRLPRLLEPYGLALPNMGDIDAQTIAGATSTGTHGSGLGFGGLATQIVAAKLVTGTGELLTVSETERPELLPAVRLGLGALGVLVEVTLQLVPRFVLRAVERNAPFDEVWDGWLDRVRAEDHLDVYWFPHTSTAFTKTNTRLPGDATRHPVGSIRGWVDDELLANGTLWAICALGYVAPSATPPLARVVERLTPDREFSDFSPRVFTANRSVRFREMEYALPLEAIPDAVREVRSLIERQGWRISLPIEVRAAASDDNWLSTAYGRESGYIAVHRYYHEDHTEYFAGVEAIMRSFAGRPHWGKMHTQTAETLREVYPRFDDFVRVRDELDPEGRFANPYLDRVLGGVRVEAPATGSAGGA
ncbi:FAD-linked oxidoreductase [Agromyces flavus]|uniref:FAD-linked oxidoreductase n=1 Tax=Agromyces flavus TaxID=589382 RepID=A0A1H1N1R2_9MICO|nr:D-arabinono-1,4-lactone oxidase [Agromyces flavus]MCP2369169.1 FAD-linked oxidoreductase [Agromyces flavus]GGI48650.1 L-gulonolactone oxidase [Agromyces flavus]SDR92820.1 FAD-linked oxidoreductase [Agromyces flavus]